MENLNESSSSKDENKQLSAQTSGNESTVDISKQLISGAYNIASVSPCSPVLNSKIKVSCYVSASVSVSSHFSLNKAQNFGPPCSVGNNKDKKNSISNCTLDSEEDEDKLTISQILRKNHYTSVTGNEKGSEKLHAQAVQCSSFSVEEYDVVKDLNFPVKRALQRTEDEMRTSREKGEVNGEISEMPWLELEEKVTRLENVLPLLKELKERGGFGNKRSTARKIFYDCLEKS